MAKPDPKEALAHLRGLATSADQTGACLTALGLAGDTIREGVRAIVRDGAAALGAQLGEEKTTLAKNIAALAKAPEPKAEAAGQVSLGGKAGKEKPPG